eukprot:TRINITY_DN3406_c0_g1_i1.p1 TRINITY_DN3406_c0_g1~~TRINITY_DN3406_c0_g1_i1.p1  ORF type:complete len:200 (+),score=40.69 TRINITY_DN3406_c0_g1_i1:120-719(+)
MAQQIKVDIYNLEGYNIGLKAAHEEKETATLAKLQQMRESYETEGLRRTVDAVMLVHQHNHPHVLLLQQGHIFKLPGGKCKPGEDEISCLKRKLSSKVAPPDYQDSQWQVGECVSVWYRPNFEALMYPYVPPHVTKPKEVKKLYLVNLPSKMNFAIPRNYKILAVPLFELYENTKRYGAVLSSLPQCLARYNLQCMGER